VAVWLGSSCGCIAKEATAAQCVVKAEGVRRHFMVLHVPHAAKDHCVRIYRGECKRKRESQRKSDSESESESASASESKSAREQDREREGIYIYVYTYVYTHMYT